MPDYEKYDFSLTDKPQKNTEKKTNSKNNHIYSSKHVRLSIKKSGS